MAKRRIALRANDNGMRELTGIDCSEKMKACDVTHVTVLMAQLTKEGNGLF
jgi:hypothetical protein